MQFQPISSGFSFIFPLFIGHNPYIFKNKWLPLQLQRKKGVKVGYLYECDAPDADCHNYGKQAGEHDMARGYAA